MKWISPEIAQKHILADKWPVMVHNESTRRWVKFRTLAELQGATLPGDITLSLSTEKAPVNELTNEGAPIVSSNTMLPVKEQMLPRETFALFNLYDHKLNFTIKALPLSRIIPIVMQSNDSDKISLTLLAS